MPMVIGRLLKGMGALLVLSALLVGAPVALWLMAGWPLPGHVPTRDELITLQQSDIPTALWMGILARLCWLSWLSVSVALVGELVGQVRGSTLRLPCLGSLQRMLAPLVAVLLLSLTSPSGRHGTGGALADRGAAQLMLRAPSDDRAAGGDHGRAGTTLAPRAAVRAAAVVGTRPPTTIGRAGEAERPPAAAPAFDGPSPVSAPAGTDELYVVERGDTLTGISETKRHTPDWHPLFAENAGQPQPGGTGVFTNPDLIFPGQRLMVPPPDPPLSAAPGPPPAAVSAPPPTPAPPTMTPSPPPRPTPPSGAVAPGTTPLPPARPPGPAGVGSDAGGRGAGSAVPQTGSSALIDLPEVGVVGLGLAGAIAAALVMARRHAWRRWRPGDGGASLRAVDALVTEPVRALEHMRMRSRLPILADELEGDPAVQPDEQGVPGSDDAPAVADAGTGVIQQRVPGWVVGAELDGAEVAVDIGALSGAGLEGPGALGAAQALILTFLMHAETEQAGLVVVGEAATLIAGLERVPGVDVVPDLGSVVGRLEDEARHREHILAEQNVADFTALATTVPWEAAVALLVVVQDTAPAVPTATRELVERGRRLGIGMVWVGASPVGASLVVSSTGELTAAVDTGGSLPVLVDGGRLPVVTPAAAPRLLEVVAAGRGAVPPPGPAAPPAVRSAVSPPDPAPVNGTRPAPRVRIRVLGPLRIEVDARPVSPGRSRGREVIAFLACHRHGVTLEQALDGLFPFTADRNKSHQLWRAAVAAARAALASGDAGGERINYEGGLYRLDPQARVDLWEFEHAEAVLACGSESRVAALEAAVAAYGGDLLEDQPWDWALRETVIADREDLRRRASQLVDELASLREETGDLRGAVSAIEKAIKVAPDAEHLYRRMMRLQAQLGCWEGGRSTYRVLEARLADLGVEPEKETRDLRDRLLGTAV